MRVPLLVFPVVAAFVLGYGSSEWTGTAEKAEAPSPPVVDRSAPEAAAEASPGPAPPSVTPALDGGLAAPVARPTFEPTSPDEAPADAFLRSSYGSLDDAARAQLARSYRRHAGTEMTEPELASALGYVRGAVATAPESYGKRFAERARLRQALGTLESPFEILLQARGADDVVVTAVDPAMPRSAGSPTPLDVTRPAAAGERTATHVRSGLTPTGRLLVLEEVEVTCVGSPPPGGRPDAGVRVDLGGSSELFVPCRRAMRCTFRGSAPLWHPDLYDVESRLSARFRRCTGSVVLRGTIVTPEARPAVAAFRVTSWEGEGYLGERVPRIQLVAPDRGEVSLDEEARRVEDVRDEPVWDDSIDPSRLRSSSAFVENLGLVPPGKVYEIRRIDYRARFPAEKGGRGELRVEWKGKSVLEVPPREKNARTDANPAGSWEGSIGVRPGEEGRLTVHASRALVEVRFFGSLVDDRER